MSFGKPICEDAKYSEKEVDAGFHRHEKMKKYAWDKNKPFLKFFKKYRLLRGVEMFFRDHSWLRMYLYSSQNTLLLI